MKKLFIILYSVLLTTSAMAIVVNNDVPNMCGERGYDVLYASYTPNSYTCNVGEYLPADALGCAACITGYTCDGGTFNYNANIDQGLTPNQINCNSGYFLPANSQTCASCPNGYTCTGGTFDFSRTESHGLTRTSTYMQGNENNVCATNFGHKVYASYTPISYTCASGQFLPANAIACASCPAGYTCSGGTYTFSAKYSQGLTRTAETYTANETNACASNFAHNLIASFVPASYTCSAGQYLPADEIACVSCPNGYTCSGGTYSFNENIDQGLVGNTITINWNGALQSDIDANDAGTVTYGGDIRTPRAAIDIPGKRFLGWRFSKPSSN